MCAPKESETVLLAESEPRISDERLDPWRGSAPTRTLAVDTLEASATLRLLVRVM
jgi:hypothetical protein